MKSLKEILLDLQETSVESEKGMAHIHVSRDRFAVLATTLHLQDQLPLSLLFATDDRTESFTFGIHALFSIDWSHEWLMVSTTVPADDARYESLTKTIMAAHWYERSIQDMFGIVVEGHPDPRRLMHHENIPEGTHPLRKDFAWNTKLDHASVPYPMHHVQGEGIYEIPVGPIHAGIIEPGHFRFNVAGERIITLEGKLFFTHKGVEKLLEGKTPEEALPFIERVSGDASASHALAFCQAIEQAAQKPVSESDAAIRTLLAELERLTMHVHDLSNIPGMGTGYTVMAAQGFRVKERLMRLSERLLGNRFWRGHIVPGGTKGSFSKEQCEDVRTTVREVAAEMHRLIDMGLRSDSLRERLETTGVLSHAAALAYGAVGLPARASGVDRDVRRDHPYAAYAAFPVSVETHKEGDVFARFIARAEELRASEMLVLKLLSSLMTESASNTSGTCSTAGVSAQGWSAVESWRGELITFVRLKDGKIDRCVVRDPSFCNWALFGEIGPGNIVPDFPLCNKSLNLSYSGTDL